MKRKSLLLATGTLFGTTLFFQNCSPTHFENIDASSVISKSGTELCSTGTKLSIFLDDAHQTYLGDVVAFSGPKDGATNYNYYSASAHPLVGPMPLGYEVQVFFYTGPDGLSLTFYANTDNAGSMDNQYALNITTLGNNKLDHVLFVDDPNQQNQPGGDRLIMSDLGLGHAYDGQFHYWSNTDGGVIGPFMGKDYSIRVEFDKTGDNRTARFFSSGGSNFVLKDQNSAISSFIIRYHEQQTCSQ